MKKMSVRVKMGIALLAGCAAAAGCAQARAETARAAGPLTALEEEVVAGVNRYRQEHGLPLLHPHARIATIARRHSEAAARGEMPLADGQGRLRARAVSATMPVQSWAEDVVEGRAAEAEAASVLTARLLATARPHVENAAFEDVGVGIARDASGKYYLTQLLILSRGGYERP
ncbi:MAG TPA: CAP domain-containing protein [Longimicrobiaceae bacterium]